MRNIFILFVLIFPNFVFSAESVSARKILALGCHNSNDTCYVSLDGPAFSSEPGCISGNEFRFDNAGESYGKRAYASFFAAYLAGKRITVYLSGCSSQNLPKLAYYSVVD